MIEVIATFDETSFVTGLATGVVGGVVGAVAGAWATGKVTRDSEERRQDFERQRDATLRDQAMTKEALAAHAEAKAVARVWIEEFRRLKRGVLFALTSDRWPEHPGPRFFSDMRHEDRLLLAGHLSKERWEAACIAHRNSVIVADTITHSAGMATNEVQTDPAQANEYLLAGIMALRSIEGGADLTDEDREESREARASSG